MPDTNPIDEVKKALSSFGGSWKENKGVWTFSTTLAERKAFLSTKKLTYSAKVKVDEPSKTVKFSEMLVESGSGLTSGDGDGISAGFGFQTETYNTFSGPRPETMAEQSTLFGKKYAFRFDHKQLIAIVKSAVEKADYIFTPQVLPVK